MSVRWKRDALHLEFVSHFDRVSPPPSFLCYLLYYSPSVRASSACAVGSLDVAPFPSLPPPFIMYYRRPTQDASPSFPPLPPAVAIPPPLDAQKGEAATVQCM